jgi:hypothetical protein
MKKIFYYLPIFFLLACVNENNNSWRISKIFTTEKTIEDVTTKDKKFIFETANGEKIECFLNYTINNNGKPIDNKTLRIIINGCNIAIKEDLRLPSSYKPIEYNISQINSFYHDNKEIIETKVSFYCENWETKIVLLSYKLVYKQSDRAIYISDRD